MPLLCVAALLLLQAVISVRTELVAVPVSVTDTRGQPITGLGPEHFQVEDEGRPQPIILFDLGDVPITLGLIVDRSQSMGAKTPALTAAVSALLASSRPGDELFAVGVNDEPSFALPGYQPFTSDPRALERALAGMPLGGRTALYDGMAAALQHLHRGHAGRSVLIVITDGGDNASVATYEQVVTLAHQSQAVVYAIGLMGTPPADEDENPGLIKRICKDTGGVAYFPRSFDAIVAAATQAARDVREQYTLGFSPEPRIGGAAFRRIKVTVRAPGKGRLHVRTRSGYMAAADRKVTP